MNALHKAIALFAITILLAPVPANAKVFPPFPLLMVEGRATTEVSPDKADLRIYISAFDAESSVAAETVQRQIVAVLTTLAGYSIQDEAITSYNLVKEVERRREDRI